ncbi:MAG: hypothetical protein EOP51_00850 [Sphingobacteriales bacterium]|nr:MAG: hypothetical protein EOP51_00850 [Sphingobacteriales bacterium]
MKKKILVLVFTFLVFRTAVNAQVQAKELKPVDSFKASGWTSHMQDSVVNYVIQQLPNMLQEPQGADFIDSMKPLALCCSNKIFKNFKPAEYFAKDDYAKQVYINGRLFECYGEEVLKRRAGNYHPLED